MTGTGEGVSRSRIVSRGSLYPTQQKGTVSNDADRYRPAQEHPHRDGDRPGRQPRSCLDSDRRDARRVPTHAHLGAAVAAAALGSGGGRHLTSWLLARGEDVVDVPSAATARVRQLSRGGGRKNDQIDAAAAACAAALQGDGRPLQPEDITDALALLDESRMNLAQSRVRLVNQLHALLRDLLAGGAPTDLSATTAAALLRQVRPSGDAERIRKQIATSLVRSANSSQLRGAPRPAPSASARSPQVV